MKNVISWQIVQYEKLILEWKKQMLDTILNIVEINIAP